MGAGAALVVSLAMLTRGLSVLGALAMIAVAALLGALGADWELGRQVKNRQLAYTAQLPDVVEVIALAVASGESIRAAIDRVCQIGSGELIAELRRMLSEVNAGKSLSDGLSLMGQRSENRNVARFCESVVAAIAQGGGLAQTLYTQAHDARDAARRDLLEKGGRAEIAMMVPVVFIIMPLSVVFTVFPALQFLKFS